MKTKLLNTVMLGMVLTATMQGEEAALGNGAIRIPLVAPYTVATELSLRPLQGEKDKEVNKRNATQHPWALLRYIHAENGHRRGSALWPDVAWRMKAPDLELSLENSARHQEKGWVYSVLTDGREWALDKTNPHAGDVEGPATPEKIRKVADGLYEWMGGVC